MYCRTAVRSGILFWPKRTTSPRSYSKLMAILIFKPDAGLHVNKFDASFSKDGRNDGGVEKEHPQRHFQIARSSSHSARHARRAAMATVLSSLNLGLVRVSYRVVG
jgi:hypothetical protein